MVIDGNKWSEGERLYSRLCLGAVARPAIQCGCGFPIHDPVLLVTYSSKNHWDCKFYLSCPAVALGLPYCLIPYTFHVGGHIAIVYH